MKVENKRLVAAIGLGVFLYACLISVIVMSSEENLDRELATGDVLKFEVTGKTGPPGPPGMIGPVGPSGPGGGGRGINVRDMGAVGDGKADDTEAFMKAIEAAKAGDTIFVPPGCYVVKKELYVDHGIHLEGEGPKSQVYQAEDLNLFHYRMYTPGYYGAAGCLIQNIALGSAAISKGRSVLLLDESPYNVLFNVFLGGGYYGLHIRGSLGTTGYSVRNITYRGGVIKDGELLGFFAPLPVPWAVIYAEPTSRFAINHTSFFATTIQQRAEYGIYMIAGSPEGGITLNGGLTEGVKQEALTLKGFTLSSSISGMWFESGDIATGHASNVKLSGCSNMNVEGCFLGGNRGLEIQGCRRIEVRGGTAWNIVTDKASKNIEIHGLLYKTLDIHSKVTRCWNLGNMGDQGSGAYGYYSGPVAGILNENTDMEQWENGLPVGYGKFGTVSRETGIVRSGKSAVRIHYRPNIAGLVYKVDPRLLSGGQTVSLRMFVWIPKGSPVRPRFYTIFNGWQSCNISPTFNKVEPETWTPINHTFDAPEKDCYDFRIVLGASYAGKEEGDIVADDIYVCGFPH